VRDGKKMAKHYLRRWFILDLFTTFPFDLFYWETIWGHTLLRLNRLFRVFHLFSYVRGWELHSRFSFVYLLGKLLVVLLVLNHWLACIYISIAYLQGFGSTPMMPKKDIEFGSFWRQYLVAFFWSSNVVSRVGGSGN